ncbi:MAG: superoxide dismutase [Myxococcales bacterium]|jgi:Fe-Mn family superoxide dismutase|nr:superoxide dismutase [Myxococcales bacterium]
MSFDYPVRDFSALKGIPGLSDEQLAVHRKLYEGYVTNANQLRRELDAMRANGQMGSLAFAELNRRLPFELDGMVLHELYFENLKPGGEPIPKGGKFEKRVVERFGSVAAYVEDLKAIAKMRGVGWALTLQDPNTGWIENRWISLHQDGNVAGHTVLLALDVWEHAWSVDHKPTERAKYLDAVFPALDFAVAESRTR